MISDRAKQIFEDAIIIDGQLAFEHAMPWSFEAKWRLVDRYKNAGFHALTLSLGNEETTTEQALVYLAKVKKYIDEHSEKYILAKTKNDILQAKREQKIALRLMFQGTSFIGKNLDLLSIFHDLGISSFVLAYNIRTPMGDGVIEQHDAGLSHLGTKLILEANRIGMLVDLAHTGYKTAMDALAVTQKPLSVSHSGVFNIHQHVRNVRDDQIKAIAQKGGVIGINGLGLLLGDPNAGIEKFIDHIDYIAQCVGPEYAAIGLDYLYFAEEFEQFMADQSASHPSSYAKQVSDATTWKCLQPENILEIIDALVARGYSDKDIMGIVGGNIMRLL